MKLKVILLTLAVLLLLADGALAMSSANYKLDWFTPMTGGGGGPSSSANYAVNFTVGQSVIGASSSANYQAGLGYWYGGAVEHRIYLPVILRNS